MTHTSKTDEHKLDTIIEALASKLYFHGHPINRTEARELGLNAVKDVEPETEQVMWELFKDFEQEFEFREPYDFMGRLIAAVPPNAGIPGQFTEVSRVEDTLTFAVVESISASARWEAVSRYTLTIDPNGGQSMQSQPITQGWRRL